MTIMTTDDTVYSFRGSIVGLPSLDGQDLTDLIREMLEMEDLFVFGGGTPANQVERMYLEYEDETLLLDRKEGSLEYAQRKASKNFS